MLFKNNYDGVLIQCLKKQDIDKVLIYMHNGPTRGYFSRDTITHKILRSSYYLPILFKDSHAYFQSCDTFQNSTGRERKEFVPLHLIDVEEPFEQWGLEIISNINPHSYKRHKYILTTTDYFTCYKEAIPLTKVNDEVVINFLEQHIMTRFVVPNTLVFDKVTYFSSPKLTKFSLEKGIPLKCATNY
jgi:hypothetical protein